MLVNGNLKGVEVGEVGRGGRREGGGGGREGAVGGRVGGASAGQHLPSLCLPQGQSPPPKSTRQDPAGNRRPRPWRKKPVRESRKTRTPMGSLDSLHQPSASQSLRATLPVPANASAKKEESWGSRDLGTLLSVSLSISAAANAVRSLAGGLVSDFSAYHTHRPV